MAANKGSNGRTEYPLGTGPLEWIAWLDASGLGHWNSVEYARTKARETMDCETIGFVLEEDDDRVTLVQSESHGTGSIDNQITIPKVAITRRCRLKRPRRRR